MGTFSIKGYEKELNKRLRALDEAKVIFKCASSAQIRMSKRIFEKGQNRTFKPHGDYDKKPIYVNTKTQSPKTLAPVGKTGESRFDNGNPHKTTYFKGGYQSFKSRIGRGSKVNFWLFGQLKSGYANGLRRKGKSWIVKLSGSNADKYSNLVKKFGFDSWMFDKKTRDLYTKCIKKKLDKQLMNV